MKSNKMNFKAKLSWLILLRGKKLNNVCCIVNTIILLSQGLETLILDLPWPDSGLERGAFSQQLFSAAAFVKQVRLCGLLVLSGLRSCWKLFPISRACLAAIQFQITLGMTLFTPLPSKGKEDQVQTGENQAECLHGPGVPWRLPALWWLWMGSSSWSQQGRKLARQNRGG